MIGMGSVEHPLLVQTGITLAHFIWQGAVVALLLVAALWLLRRRPAGERYVACGGALLMMALCPVATMVYVHSTPLPIRPTEETAPETAPLVLDAPGDDVTGHVVAWAPTAERETDAGSAVEPAGEELAPDGHTTDSRSVDAATALPDSVSGTPAAPRWASVRLSSDWLATGFALAALAWSFGVTVLAVRMMLGWANLRRLRRKAEPLAAQVDQVVRRLRERLGLSSTVRVMATPAASEPVAFGLFRPIVLVPVSLMTSCPIELVEAWVAHELAHIRRHDLWVNLFQRVVETLLFYHPAVWWVSRRMRLERELCCDDLAVAATGRRPEYAEALVEVARVAHSSGSPMLAAGVFGTNVSLLARVRRVLQLPQPPRQSRFWLAGPLSLLLAGSLAFAAHLHGADLLSPSEADGPVLTESAQAETNGTTEPEATETPVQVPEAPSIEPPETAVIEASFDELRERLASERARIEEQRAMLVPAVASVQAVYAFRDALYDGKMAEVRRWFKPGGKAASEEDIKGLLDDLRTLGIAKKRYEAWTVNPVWVPEDKSSALASCSPFVVEREGAQWTMRVSCQVVPDKEDGWVITKISVAPTRDDDYVLEQFARAVPPDQDSGRRQLWRIWFDNARGCPSHYQPFRAGRPVRGERWTKYARGPQRDFPEALRDWQCFEPQPEPAPPRQPSRPRRPRAAEARKRAEALAREEPPRPEPVFIPVRSMADGLIAEVKVNEGQTVKSGDLLVRLDDEEIALELQAADVRLQAAKAAYERAKRMFDRGRASDEEISQTRSTLQLAELDVRRWQLRLERTRIASPAEGKVNFLREPVSPGQKVSAGDLLLYVMKRENGSTGEAEPAEEEDHVRDTGGAGAPE